ncbi:MAG TPA: methyltransferase domain-containing protein [Myxococcota bacterium]|nr:methyltransferase domain-containing protein [Myxococcota bacterium]
MTPTPSSALRRALPLLKLPTEAQAAPERLLDENGVLDLLGARFAPTPTQRMLDTRFTAWFYDRTRDALAPVVGMQRFPEEAQAVADRLDLVSGDAVLDVACGHGNFTVELARRVGPQGLVVGLDIAASMLARAARRVARAGLTNVLLVRGDALALPVRDGAFAKVNCSGGLHQLPDLERAFAEMARVAAPGARFAGSGFAESGEGSDGWRGWLRRRLALHVVPLAPLARELQRAGFADVATQAAGPVGYVWGQRAY